MKEEKKWSWNACDINQGKLVECFKQVPPISSKELTEKSTNLF